MRRTPSAALVAAALVLVLAGAACISTPPSTRSRSDTQLEPDQGGLQREVAEAAETGKARLEALRHARDAGRLGLKRPVRSIPTPGWTTERVWNAKMDDWEPAIAADPSSPYVYALATRYGGPKACPTCRSPRIVLHVSADGGKTWGPDRFLCVCADVNTGQYDPIIEVDGNGVVHAVWLNGFTPGATYSRSNDHGQTWSTPLSVPAPWSDKPVLAVSDSGQDVYIAYNGPHRGDLLVAVSHDGGATFVQRRVTDVDRYFFEGGAWTSPDGRQIAFAVSDYSLEGYHGRIHSDVAISNDGGATWTLTRLATGDQQPNCTSAGCKAGFYGPTPTLAGDPSGRLVYVYSANSTRLGPQRVYALVSPDAGQTWGQPISFSPAGANAIFPAAASGGPGDFRVWWMDTRTGLWNVWYTSTTDGGATWTTPIRLSNATSGTPYKRPKGFLEAYGDYGEIDVTNEGKTVAIWGEGPSYDGPGGAWFIRQS